MRRLWPLWIFFTLCHSFDLVEFIEREHEKTFFGAGGGAFQGLNDEYVYRFSGGPSPFVVLGAGTGDYPFVLDVRYAVYWTRGLASGGGSSGGARLTEYQVLPGARLYLAWRHPRLKTYLLIQPLGSQEKMVEARGGGTTEYRFTRGIRMGIGLGLGFDLRWADYSFADLSAKYMVVDSEFLGKKELFLSEIIVNVGR